MIVMNAEKLQQFMEIFQGKYIFVLKTIKSVF